MDSCTGMAFFCGAGVDGRCCRTFSGGRDMGDPQNRGSGGRVTCSGGGGANGVGYQSAQRAGVFMRLKKASSFVLSRSEPSTYDAL